MNRQRGFVVAELMLAISLFLGLGLAALAVFVMLNNVIRSQGDVTASAATVDQEMDRMRSDASSAYAVYVPLTDVFGASNASQGQVGHEVAFLTRDSQNHDLSWAYDSDAGKGTLQRYDFDTIGRVGVRDLSSGIINTAASYTPITGVTGFSAQTLEASDLTKPSNLYRPIISSLVSEDDSLIISEPVGILHGNGDASFDLYGGNTIIQIEVKAKAGTRTLHLATAAMPSGFTVPQKAQFRVYIYSEKRVELHGLFGNLPISLQNVYAQVRYSYNPETDPPAKWKIWCDFNLYKLRTNDARHGGLYINYVPDRYSETVAAVYHELTNSMLPDPGDDRPCPVMAPAE